MMYYESELYHHGIKGQKWGVQHGPPYPLDRKTIRQRQKQSKRDKKINELENRKKDTTNKMEESVADFKNSKNAISSGKNYVKAYASTSNISVKKLLKIEGIIAAGMAFEASLGYIYGFRDGKHK